MIFMLFSRLSLAPPAHSFEYRRFFCQVGHSTSSQRRAGTPVSGTLQAVDPLVLVVFLLVYAGMMLGGLPGLALDRAGVAVLGAIVLVAGGRVTPLAAMLALCLLVTGRSAGVSRVTSGWRPPGGGLDNQENRLRLCAVQSEFPADRPPSSRLGDSFGAAKTPGPGLGVFDCGNIPAPLRNDGARQVPAAAPPLPSGASH